MEFPIFIETKLLTCSKSPIIEYYSTYLHLKAQVITSKRCGFSGSLWIFLHWCFRSSFFYLL